MTSCIARALCLSAVLLGACTGGARVPARAGGVRRARPASSAAESLLALVAQLPNGADRCTVGRPGALSDDERRVMAEVSGAPPMVWLPELGAEAFAVASRRRLGRISRVHVLRVRASPDQVRARLRAHSGLQLTEQPGPHGCGPDGCPTALRFVAPDIVVLERGEWLSVPGAGGVEQRCAELVRSHPQALELAARRGDSRADGRLVPILRTSGYVERRSAGLVCERVDVMATPEVAEAVVLGRLTRPLLSWHAGPPPGVVGQLRRRAEGARAHTRLEVTWDELAMLQADQAREQAAIAYADALGQMRPADDVDVDQLEAFLQQVNYRAEALQHAGPGEDTAMARSLRELLQRGLVAHPERRDLARLLARVLLEELSAGDDAIALSERMAALAGVDQAFWAQVARHGAALDQPDRLASLLRAHGMATRAQAPKVAHDILFALRNGASFDAAERAALAQVGLMAATARAPLPVLPPVSPADLLESLLLLARSSGDAPFLWVSLEGPLLPSHLDVAVSLSDGVGARAVAQLPRDGFEAARALGRGLSELGRAEAVSLRLSPGHGDGPGERVLVLAGRLEDGLLRLERADARAAQAPWEVLMRSLVMPVAMLSLGRVVVPVPPGGNRRRMRELAEGAFGLVCRTGGAVVSCHAAHHGRDHARAALAAIVAEPLAPAARALFRK